MTPTIEHDCFTLYQGDCLEVLPTIEAGSVDAVITDPPYGMRYNTNSHRFSGGNGHNDGQSGHGRNWGGLIIGDDKPFDPAPFLNFNKVVLWGSNHYLGRLPIGTTLVWIKRLDAAFGSFLSDAEIAWMKGGQGVYCFRDLSMFSAPHNRQHPNQKPIELMKWCIKKVSKTNDIILDPFMGSGSTGVAAMKTGRRFIGIELDPEYFRIAAQRIQNAAGEFVRTDKEKAAGQLSIFEVTND